MLPRIFFFPVSSQASRCRPFFVNTDVSVRHDLGVLVSIRMILLLSLAQFVNRTRLPRLSLPSYRLLTPRFQMHLPDRPMRTLLNGAGLQDFSFSLFLIIQAIQYTLVIVENGSGAISRL